MSRSIQYPGGKQFAFGIVDDTDLGTVKNLGPVYDFLHDLGFRTTKTVWVQRSTTPDKFDTRSQTLSDPEYLRFTLELQRRGFEIAMHLAAPGTSCRASTAGAYERFNEVFGHYPTININHCDNREGMYWGRSRFDNRLMQIGYDASMNRDQYCGHDETSDLFWGDICQRHTKYVRDFVFQTINTARADPFMPYHDTRRPYVNYWFSSSDGAKVKGFNSLLTEANQERLVRERGCCIVYTHFGKDFVQDGTLNPIWKKQMTSLAERNGWFAPTSEILDLLLSHRPAKPITRLGRKYLCSRWLLEKARSTR